MGSLSPLGFTAWARWSAGPNSGRPVHLRQAGFAVKVLLSPSPRVPDWPEREIRDRVRFSTWPSWNAGKPGSRTPPTMVGKRRTPARPTTETQQNRGALQIPAQSPKTYGSAHRRSGAAMDLANGAETEVTCPDARNGAVTRANTNRPPWCTSTLLLAHFVLMAKGQAR